MTATTRDPTPSAPLRVAEAAGILPDLPELRPFVDLLVLRSEADPARRWAGSGELGTVGERVVPVDGLGDHARTLADAEGARLVELLTDAARLVERMAGGDWEEVISMMMERGEREEGSGRSASAEPWYLSAHRIARERGDARAPTALRLAGRCARTRGALDVAAARYEQAWSDAGDLDRREDRIVAAIGRGNLDVDRGLWEGAERWYERALALIAEEGAPRPERWQVLHNLAIVRRRRGDFGGARAFLDRAGREAARGGEGSDHPNADVVEKIENGWGQILLAEGEFRAAELHLLEALKAAGSPLSRVPILVNLGEALLGQGRTLEAGERGREAEAVALAGAAPHRLPEVYRLLAAVARERGDDDAFVFLEEALRLIRERGLPAYEEALTREAYGTHRLALGEADRARAELAAAAEIYERIGMVDAARRIEAALGRPPGGHP